MSQTLNLLLGSTDADFRAQVQALSERIKIVSRDELRDSPELLSTIEVAYGGIGAKELPNAKALRWLQVGSAGVNGLLTPELRDSDLIVTNVSGIHAQPITEHMFGMLLMVTRCLNQAWEQQKTHQWEGFDFNANLQSLFTKTLGVLGVGAIGGQAAKVGKAFGMRVVGLRNSGEAHPDVEEMFTPEERLKFFAKCDVVMNTLPLTEASRGFMGAEEFAALPEGAIVVNAGRGATIDTEALMAALKSGRVQAALLDVTDPEPLPANHPLWEMPNVFITPHYSGGHPEYDQRANAIFLENLQRYLVGEPLNHVVDKHEGY